MAAFVLHLAPGPSRAADWYVDGLNGGLTNTGSAAQPFLNAWQAAAVAQPGDTIYVLPTVTYTRLSVLASGTAAQPITVVGTGLPPNRTRITGSGTDNAIWINADHVIVANFDASAPGQFSGYSVAPGHHHVTIARSVVHDSGGSGINTFGDDYIVVSHNVVYGNAKNTMNFRQGSGISLLGALDVDSFAGVKNVIDGNIVYQNTNVPYCATPACFATTLDSDGSGIILDDFQRKRFDGIAYRGQTLISNNVVFGNGGRGIYMYRSDHAVIIGNTVAFNNQDPYGGNWHPGEVGIDEVGDTSVLNNILFNDGKNGPNRTGTAPNFHVSFSAENCSDGTGPILLDHNMMFALPNTQMTQYYLRQNANPFLYVANVFTDPKLENPTLDPATADFRPRPASPVLGAADPAHTLTYDALWLKRAVPNSIGAYDMPGP